METELHRFLELPRSRLSVADGALIHTNSDGIATLSLPIGEIDQVRVERAISWAMLLVGLAFVGIGVLLWSMSTSNLLRWIGSLSCSLLGAVALLSVCYPALRVNSSQGRLSFELADSDELVRGFVLSLEHLQARKIAVG